MMSLAIAVPTRNRPEKLFRCLEALAIARRFIEFSAVIGDSSILDEVREEVDRIVSIHPFARVIHHDREGVAAARNACAEAIGEELIINVDDDVYVEPLAIKALYDFYIEKMQGGCDRVIAGSVRWGSVWSGPVIKRWNGYGRAVSTGETPSFLIGAFFLYSKEVSSVFPWNERVVSSDDIYMGALWTSHGVKLDFTPDARAHHDVEQNTYGVEHCTWLIYVNLFDSLVANRSIARALSYEILGFSAGAKTYFRRPSLAVRYVAAWFKGHQLFIRDISLLREDVAPRRLRLARARPIGVD